MYPVREVTLYEKKQCEEQWKERKREVWKKWENKWEKKNKIKSEKGIPEL